MLGVKPPPATLGQGAAPMPAAPIELGIVDKQVETASGDVEPDQVAVTDKGERPSDDRLRATRAGRRCRTPCRSSGRRTP